MEIELLDNGYTPTRKKKKLKKKQSSAFMLEAHHYALGKRSMNIENMLQDTS